MRKSDDIFLSGLQNMQVIARKPGREFNRMYFSQLGIKDEPWLSILQNLSPVLYLVNVLYAMVFILMQWIVCMSVFLLRKPQSYENIDRLGLLFHRLLPERMKTAGVFDDVQYWIVGPNMLSHKSSLIGKTVLDYQSVLSFADTFRILGSSLKSMVNYLLHFSGLCLIHKTWEYYEVCYALKKIAVNSSIYFANQSDRWAVLCDVTPSGEKHLFQHGVTLNWDVLPHRLHNVDVFYALSDNTWKDAYRCILTNSPRLVVMPPTITLTPRTDNRFRVLIVSEVSVFDCDIETLRAFGGEDVEIFWKRHPGFKNDSCYSEQKKNFDFVYITEQIFPEVDFVVSYYSTLAFEYMVLGIPVYLYMGKNDYDVRKMLEAYHAVREGAH